MAQRNYLIEGVSGTGKSSVYDELMRRGYKAVSTDRAWRPRPASAWDERKALRELDSPLPEVLFVCGGGGERFLSHFTKVFELRVDDETLRRRLAERTNNDFGKDPEELALVLRLNSSGERLAGAIDVDATRPLEQVVDEVLRLAGCDTVGGSWRPAWSRSGVVATLERYLDERGVDRTRLDPRVFDVEELQRYYEAVNGGSADGVGYAMLDEVAFLRDTLVEEG
jgi:broad-specificity NMP kinase